MLPGILSAFLALSPPSRAAVFEAAPAAAASLIRFVRSDVPDPADMAPVFSYLGRFDLLDPALREKDPVVLQLRAEARAFLDSPPSGLEARESRLAVFNDVRIWSFLPTQERARMAEEYRGLWDKKRGHLASKVESLRAIFEAGGGDIRHILDFGTGDGQWMRRAPLQAWFKEGGSVTGVDLRRPQIPNVSNEMWMGLNVVTPREMALKFEPASFDLVHEALKMPWNAVTHVELWWLDHLLRDGGWFLFAHIDGPGGALNHRYYLRWLQRKGYPYRVYRPGGFPEDYPASYWWEKFMEDPFFHKNYLIVARKDPERARETPYLERHDDLLKRPLLRSWDSLVRWFNAARWAW